MEFILRGNCFSAHSLVQEQGIPNFWSSEPCAHLWKWFSFQRRRHSQPHCLSHHTVHSPVENFIRVYWIVSAYMSPNLQWPSNFLGHWKPETQGQTQRMLLLSFHSLNFQLNSQPCWSISMGKEPSYTCLGRQRAQKSMPHLLFWGVKLVGLLSSKIFLVWHLRCFWRRAAFFFSSSQFSGAQNLYSNALKFCWAFRM